MKKIIALFLVMATAAVVLCGCGTFNVKSINPLDYVSVGDFENFSIDEFRRAYEAEREEMAGSSTSFSVDWGYSVEMNVICEVLGGDGKTVTYTKVDEASYEGNNTLKVNIYENTDDAYAADFDSALVYSIKEAGTSTAVKRTLKIGTAFDFTMVLPTEDRINAPALKALAGKTVRFTVTPVKVLPPVFDDSYIADELTSFFDKYSATRTYVESGDIVTADIDGNIDGELLDGLKYESRIFVCGYSEYPMAFDEAIKGMKKNEKRTFEVAFPSDWANEELAGKTAEFTVKVTAVTSYNKAVEENTDYKTLYELKEALRLELYVENEIMNTVYGRSTLDKNLDGLYKEYLSYLRKSNESEIKKSIQYYAANGLAVTRAEIIEAAYGSEAAYTRYLENAARNTVLETLVCYAVADKLGIEYTEENYKADLKDFTEDYNTINSTEYTTSQVENICNKNLLMLIFIEEDAGEILAGKLDGIPVLK